MDIRDRRKMGAKNEKNGRFPIICLVEGRPSFFFDAHLLHFFYERFFTFFFGCAEKIKGVCYCENVFWYFSVFFTNIKMISRTGCDGIGLQNFSILILLRVMPLVLRSSAVTGEGKFGSCLDTFLLLFKEMPFF